MMLIQLGRFGDIINVLPLAYSLSKKVGRVNWVVGKDHASILEGASYVQPMIWEGGQDTLPLAIQHYRGSNPIVTQAWLNPDREQQTDSFMLEQWRHAGMLDQFGSLPLIFDQQNLPRANMLRDRVLSRRNYDRPLILACVDGISGPFKPGPKLLAMLRGLDADVIDMRDVRADRVYDLLPLLNAADCLVTIDTMFLHLARAAICPVVALLNDGWIGTSVPPPQTVAAWRYSVAIPNLDTVVSTAEKVITAKLDNFVVVANVFGQTERHLKARENWPHKQVIAKKNWGRSAKTVLKNDRALPFLKDLLQAGLDSGADTVLWVNDDCSFAPNAFYQIQKHCAVFDFGCVRRDPTHCGREAFFFRSAWLRQHIAVMPDVVVGTEKFDLVIARWLRAFRGIKTTEENLLTDFFPVELPPGLIQHEEHESWWTSPEAIQSPATKHNFALWNAGV
jgi:hypothetical protein